MKGTTSSKILGGAVLFVIIWNIGVLSINNTRAVAIDLPSFDPLNVFSLANLLSTYTNPVYGSLSWIVNAIFVIMIARGVLSVS